MSVILQRQQKELNFGRLGKKRESRLSQSHYKRYKGGLEKKMV